MRFDFSAAGRAARDGIAVPAVPYDAIRRRSHEANFRARAQLLGVCLAVALIGVSTATGFAQKTLATVRIWLSGGKAAVAVDSFVMIRDPLSADAQRVIDSASFTPVLPTHFPPGTHVSRLMYSPSDKPNMISVQYLNDQTGYHSGLTVVATSAIEQGSAAPLSAVSSTAYSWRVGDETVVIPREHATAAQIQSLKVDLSSAKPRTLQESLLRTLTVLGARPDVADAVQKHAVRGSVLLGRQFVGEIPHLTKLNRPLLDSRIVTLTNIPSKSGVPDYSKATLHWSTRVVVPILGIKAVNAVLHASSLHCKCSVLYSGEAGDAYDVALVVSSSPYAVVRYSVSKTTMLVHRADR